VTITRKPKLINHKDKIDVLIDKGGSVSGETKINCKSYKNSMTLRLPHFLLEQINEILSEKLIPTPRHTWILEAILEKVQRELGKPRA
jgi:hypothetical protein